MCMRGKGSTTRLGVHKCSEIQLLDVETIGTVCRRKEQKRGWARRDRLREQHMDLRLFGRRLRAARTACGYEEAASFAADLNVPTADYLEIEDGKREPDLHFVEDTARLTGRTIDFLVLGRGPSKSPA